MRLTKPWSLLTDLTDDQKQQLAAIHADAVEKQKALDAEEESKCMAILSDAQKTALADAQSKEVADRKSKAAEAKAKPKD